ncbi:MAG: PQQ-binding-like beta-propeller repeat protein [Alistipes sp.]|nr:PQQ-binding-like beta-propeller repeat protein [Alistipes sp.]
MKRLIQLLASAIAVAIIVASPANAANELPDTCYVSASNIVYRVDIADTITPPKLRSFKDLYAEAPGIFTFRGSPRRDMAYCGKLDSIPSKIQRVWCFRTDFDSRVTDYGTWGGGSGWTGQPVYVEWSDSLMELQRRESCSLTADFRNKEIIVGSLCGKVYFIDYNTGRASRTAFAGKNPIKGSVSLDPRLNGNLYIGHGIPAADNSIGAVVFNLFNHKQLSYFGRDKKAWRGWGAYDAAAIVVDNFMIRVSENGTIYKFTTDGKSFKLHSSMRYRINGVAPGIESSPAVWKNYMYTCDNRGNVLCVNINTLRPVWRYNNHDDSDATIVLAEEERRVVLYTATELDKQGSSGYCYFTKLDALTGELIWQNKIRCRKLGDEEKPIEGGMFATPLFGHGNCEGLIFTNICGMGSSDVGTFIAISRKTGEIVYRTRLAYYAWSSPVALYTPDSRMYIFTGDIVGNAYLIDAESGKILFKKTMANNFESSPVVIGNTVVVGSRGREIYKFEIL